MKEGKKAAFRFDRFHIPEFSFKEVPDSTDEKISIRFEPSGIYNPENGVFKLTVNFIASADAEGEQEMIRSSFIAYFEFDEKIPLEEIPVYFYRNSLAIVFPYIRSFVSNLTMQANIKLIILPVLNLSELEAPLKANTIIEGAISS